MVDHTVHGRTAIDVTGAKTQFAPLTPLFPGVVQESCYFKINIVSKGPRLSHSKRLPALSNSM